jgi:hypothetical protein
MPKSDPNLLTQAEYARSRKARELPGGSREAVRKAVEEKRISVFGPDKLIDAHLADSQWERNTRARVGQAAAGSAESVEAAAGGAESRPADLPAAQPVVESGYNEARTRRERAEADEAEMRTAKMRGAMVMREDVDRAMFEIGRELRDRLMACARRIAAEVASVNTAEGCEAVIEREHRIVLELLVTNFREKVGAPVKGGAA